MDVAQHGVLPEPADHDEPHENYGGDYLLLGVERVGDQYVGDFQQLLLDIVNDLDVPVVQVHHLSLFVRVLLEPFPAGGLHRPEGHAPAPRGVDDADARYLKPALGGLRTAGPEYAEPPRELARLGDVALVDGGGQQVGGVGEHLPDEGGVVAYPIHGLAEEVAVSLLAMLPVLSHLGEIDFPHRHV